MRKIQVQSTSNPNAKPYDVTIDDDGNAIFCTCIGHRTNRRCKHTTKINGQRASVVLTNEHPATFTRTGGTAVAQSVEQAQHAADVANRFATRGYVQPMLAQPLDGKIETFANASWWLEEKFDGHRVVVVVDEARNVTAYSRPKAGSTVGLTRDLPSHIVTVARCLLPGTYDGELMAPTGKFKDVTRVEMQSSLYLMLFDLLAIQGTDMTSRKAIERREILDGFSMVFAERGITEIRVSERLAVSQANVDAIWARGGEGAMLKRAAAQYRPGARSVDWLKVKKTETALLTIVGFEAGKNGAHSAVMLRGVASNGETVETTVKTLNNAWLRVFATNANDYIGRTLRIEHKGLEQGPKGWKYRNPMFDHVLEVQ